MYPVTCAGGHAVPIKAGRFEIYGVAAIAEDTTASMRLTFVDSSQNKILADEAASGTVIIDLQGDTMFGEYFPEPIKVRNGICVTNATNVLAGRTRLMIR